MRTARFVIGGALGLALFAASALAAPGTSNVVSAPARQQVQAPQEMLVQAEGLVSKISSQLDDNRVLQSIARDTRDSLKLGCLDNQVVVGRALLEASQSSLTSLRAAVRSGRDIEVPQQYLMIATLAGEADSTHRAAASCLGSKEITHKRLALPVDADLPLPGSLGTSTSLGTTNFQFPTHAADVGLASRPYAFSGARPVPASP